MTIYTLPSKAKELTAATHIMQSSSNKLSTSVSDSTKCKQTKVNTKCLIITQADIGHQNGWA